MRCQGAHALVMTPRDHSVGPLRSNYRHQVSTSVRRIRVGIRRQAGTYQDHTCWLQPHMLIGLAIRHAISWALPTPLSQTKVTDDTGDTTFGKLFRRQYV